MQIIGHRGARDLAPENTVAGIKFALRRKVDWIEFDVHRTKDNKLIVIHDSFSRFVKRGGRLVRDCTLAELQKQAKQSGQRIATFEEIIKAIGTKAKVDIELKTVKAAHQVVAEVQRQVADGRSYDDFMISSMFVKALEATHRLDRSIHLAYINEFASAIFPFKFLSVLRRVPLHAIVFWSYATPKVAIDMAKKHGLEVIVHTVNDRPLAAKLERRGVDAIITDRPQEFLSLWPLIWRWMLGVALLLLLCYVVWLGLA